MSPSIQQLARKHGLSEDALIQAVRRYDPQCKDRHFVPKQGAFLRALRDLEVQVEGGRADSAPDPAAPTLEPPAVRLTFRDDDLPAHPKPPVSCRFSVRWHADIMDRLNGDILNGPLGRRLGLVLRHLTASGRTSVVKGTRGNDNKGWRRSPLGGKGGNHFYLWWAPSGAPPVQSITDQPRMIFIRDIRHHDEHRPLGGGRWEDYSEASAPELTAGSLFPVPWTQSQQCFARSAAPVRVLRGYPGTGKTTALWNAVQLRGGEKVLYLTWSTRLAETAAEYFDSFRPLDTTVQVGTFGEVFQEVLGAEAGEGTERQGREEFFARVRKLAPSTLGPWRRLPESLYAEVRAHLVGEAIPAQGEAEDELAGPRLDAAAYRERRWPALGEAATGAVLDVVRALENDGPIGRYFPDLWRAWFAGLRLMNGAELPANRASEFERLVVDEVQDLTPVEAAALLFLARRAGEARDGVAPFVLLAGDEGQTVRPTDFEWGWFKELVARYLDCPEEMALMANVRSPRRIAALVNFTRDLYRYLPKDDRPRGIGDVDVEDATNDVIIHCVATPGPALAELLTVMKDFAGLAIVRLNEELPDYIPEPVREIVLTPSEVKGLDYQAVCVLDAAQLLEKVANGDDRPGRGSEVERLWKRTAIDHFRVTISRPAETLILLDVDPAEGQPPRLHALLRDLHPTSMDPEELRRYLLAQDLSPEERVQQYITDALSLVEVRPTVAWRRAHQAVSLLGERRDLPHAVADPTLRAETHLTLVRVALHLLTQPLPPPMTREQTLRAAASAAARAARADIAGILEAVLAYEQAHPVKKGRALLALLNTLALARGVEAWVRTGLRPLHPAWMQALEELAGQPSHCLTVCGALPLYYRALELSEPEARHRANQTRGAVVDALLGGGHFAQALQIAEAIEPPALALRARCCERLGRYAEAAGLYEQSGDREAALRMYRQEGDVENAARVLEALGEHPDREVVLWLRQVLPLLEHLPSVGRERFTQAEWGLLLATVRAGMGQGEGDP
jgi:hypothetical protein